MGNQSFAEVLNSAGTMASGLRTNLSKLAKRGMDEKFISGLEAQIKKVMALNNEQEALKSRLKEKSAEVDTGFATIKDQIAEAKKVVKLSLDQPSWKEFGIGDVR